MKHKEPKGIIWTTDLGKQDERTNERTDGRTNERTDSLLELAGFYPPAKNFVNFHNRIYSAVLNLTDF